jgi:hypothetical protein
MVVTKMLVISGLVGLKEILLVRQKPAKICGLHGMVS